MNGAAVVFYGGRETRYIGKKRADRIRALFEGSSDEAGIVMETELARVAEQGPCSPGGTHSCPRTSS